MEEKNDFGFLDYDYYGVYYHDPLYVLMINEQFEVLRKSFYCLDEDTQNILDYFIIQRNDVDNIDMDIDKYINNLKRTFLDLYSAN